MCVVENTEDEYDMEMGLLEGQESQDMPQELRGTVIDYLMEEEEGEGPVKECWTTEPRVGSSTWTNDTGSEGGQKQDTPVADTPPDAMWADAIDESCRR